MPDVDNPPAAPSGKIGNALEIPADRRALAEAHAALLAQTAASVALTLPFSADVDDFRRVLAQEAAP
jgi:hypothetical protein